MIDKVVLINGVCYSTHTFINYSMISSGSKNLGLLTIQEALKTASFYQVEILPSKPIPIHVLFRNDELKTELHKAVGSAKNPLFGISTTTDQYFKLEPIVRRIREDFPESKVILGGPHFKRDVLTGGDGTKYKDTVEVALGTELLRFKEKLYRWKLGDAVVVHHAQPFIDLVTKHGGDLERVVSKGLYRLGNDGRVVGSEVGLYPKVRSLPYLTSEESIGIIIRDLCGNLCDICSIAGGINSDLELATNSLFGAFQGKSQNKLVLHDSNPFNNGVTPFYEKLFSDFDSNTSNTIYKESYLDPASLTTNYDQLMQFFIRHNFYSFSIGRDAITYKNAAYMGTKTKGKVKTQKQLNAEGQALIKFINEMSNKRKPGAPKYEFTIHYIMTPIETERSALAMVQEMEYFQKLSNKNADVKIKVFALCPEPGTEVQKRHIDYINNPEEYWLRTTYTSDWKDEMGPAAYLLDIVGLLGNAPDLTPGQRFYALRKAIHDIYRGRATWLDKSKPDGIRLKLGVTAKDMTQPWHSAASGNLWYIKNLALKARCSCAN